ncbi:MAG: general secretion pathway protein GspB [Halioglobus sp.]
MSLILEALNRSQRDRQVDAGAGRDTADYFESSEVKRSRLSWLPWLALVFALLIIGWLLSERFAADVVQTPSTPKEISVVAQIAPSQVQPEKPARADPPEEADTVPIATGSQMPPSIMANSASAEVPGKSNVEPDVADSAVAALYAGREEKAATAQTPVSAKKENSSLTEKPVDIEAVLARTEEALKTARLREHPAPFLSTLSQQVKNDVPTMLYSGHDYSSKSGQSSVVINGKTLREGGNIVGGVKLDEILPDSIVLSHRGTQFRLRALNSWVNL